MKNRSHEFRTALAEKGIEMTPEQARKAYRMIRGLKKTAKKLSTIDMWQMENDDSLGFSKEERKQMVELYRMAKEI